MGVAAWVVVAWVVAVMREMHLHPWPRILVNVVVVTSIALRKAWSV